MVELESVKESNGVAILSLAGGVIIVLAAIGSWFWHMLFFPDMGWMMGPQWFTVVWAGRPLVGVISGALVILGAVMMNKNPSENYKWGALVLIFSLISLIGMGGFAIGAVLGMAGGILALVKR